MLRDLEDIFTIFSAHSDYEAVRELAEKLCALLRKDYDCDLAMVFTTTKARGGWFFRPLASADHVRGRDHPDAKITDGLLGYSYGRKQPILAQGLSLFPGTNPSILVNHFDGSTIPSGQYFDFDDQTDENIVFPLFGDANADGPRVAGMINIERSKRNISWTRETVAQLQKQLENFGPILHDAQVDAQRRARLRALLNEQWAANLDPSSLRPKKNVSAADKTNFDVAIICALDSPELSAVFEAFGGMQVWSQPFGEDPFVLRSTNLKLDNGSAIKVLSAAPSRMGLTATAVITSQLILQYRPKIVVMTGIAAGCQKDKQDYGDIMIPAPAVDYASGKIYEREGKRGFNRDGHSVDLDSTLKSILNDTNTWRHVLDDIRNTWSMGGREAPGILRLHVGPMGAADQVVDDPSIPATLKEQFRKLVGLDMETYAVYRAASDAPRPHPLFVAFKAISDFPGMKSDEWQAYAAYTSAQFAMRFLKLKWERILSVHSPD